PEDGYLQNELEASFPYEDTPDQVTATEDVKTDMQKPNPMDRLICGDVGFGKTEVAIRAVFKAVLGGKQVAVLVPTTILALQHFNTFSERLSDFGVTIDYINRFKTAKQKRMILERLKEGSIDVVIGTHSLLNKKVEFKDLGLLVVDEEQKFGVTAKEKLRAMKVDVDTLTLTATPIPRTLQFSLMGARDMSVLRTPPANRQPIHTEVRPYNIEVIKDAIYYEIDRSGQVFFVHNRVKSLPDIHQMLKKLCPEVDFTMAHGQMESNQLETKLVDFIEGKADVLLCTNIIETGLDISNVNTIIINNAHHFGLSDLHQLRGRVGRSNKKAYCYLIIPPYSALTADARKRLKTIEEFTDLGSGIHIAMRDLDIRGAGSLLGAEQSGFINDIGYDAYQKILEEAVIELKETEFKTLFEEEMADEKRTFVRDVDLDMDVEMLIPDQYVSNTQERLKLYKELDDLKSEDELEEFAQKLKDRFGDLPGEVYNLFDAFRIRWSCKKLGIERLTLKGTTMKCFFPSNPQSAYYQSPVFGGIMQFVAEKGRKLNMYLKQSKDSLILTKNKVGGLHELKEVISQFEKEAKI
nr:DEAD/DEAH box helicase [Saprospiraceae bacterium]